MITDPKKDPHFQFFMKGVIRQVVIDISKKMLENKNIDYESIEPQTEIKKLIEKLIHLRSDFVVKNIFSKSLFGAESLKESLDNLNKVRNTREAQDFLEANPYFFTTLDRSIFDKLKPSLLFQGALYSGN